MNKLLNILFILSCISCKGQTNEGIIINPIIKPNFKYSTIVTTESNSTIEYSGNNGIIEELESKGIDYPITSLSTTIIKSTMKTGKPLSGNKFGILCSYDTVETKNEGSITKLKQEVKLIEKMQGAKAFGFVNENHEIELDSITGISDESIKATIEQTLTTMLDIVEYPKKKIHVGDSFTTKSPINMPFENGAVMDMNIVNTYRLDSIIQSIAFFNIKQQIESTTTVKDQEIGIEGKGVGQIQYNIAYQSYDLYETTIEMNSIVEIQGIKILTKAINKSTTKTEVKAR